MGELRDELQSWADRYGALPAVYYLRDDERKEISYHNLVGMTGWCCEWFLRQKEQRVALLGENSYGWFCSFYGALLAGKDVVLCDMLLPVGEMREVLQGMDVQKVILSPELRGLEEEICSVKDHYTFDFWEVPVLAEEQAEAYIQLIREKSSDLPEGSMIALTSGTTSKAKGVITGMEAFVNNNKCLAECLEGQTGDRVYTSLPMHHPYGVNKTFAFFHKGATVCLGKMRTIRSELQIYKPRFMLAVPTVVEFLEKTDAFVPEVECIIVSGCKCEKRIEEICRKRGIFVQNIYGSSESAGGMALNLRGDSVDELSVIPGRRIEIADDGEILVHTPWSMSCYYKNKEATEEKLQNQVLYTGDMGYFDENGRLHISGRKKDMIAMENGDKIYCEETDEILSSLEGVEEAAVLYVNKKLIAVIYPQAGVSVDTIKQSIDQYNSKQQLIRKMSGIWMRKTPLPRTSTGKMKRNELMQQYLKNN